MNDDGARGAIPAVRSLAPGALVALGALLWMVAGKEWIAVAGVGAFGPGILRELGLLDDQDEFQRVITRRAAYRAYLVGGMATVLVVAALHLDGRPPDFPAELITFLLVVSWLTWTFSYLMDYWGPARTASRVLLTFGAFWALFVVLDAVGEAGGVGQALIGLGVGTVLVSPFFGGAYAAHRWPRPTGRLLLVAAVGMTVVFVIPGRGSWSTRLLTPTLLIVPLAACGLGLLRSEREDDPGE